MCETLSSLLTAPQQEGEEGNLPTINEITVDALLLPVYHLTLSGINKPPEQESSNSNTIRRMTGTD